MDETCMVNTYYRRQYAYNRDRFIKWMRRFTSEIHGVYTEREFAITNAIPRSSLYCSLNK